MIGTKKLGTILLGVSVPLWFKGRLASHPADQPLATFFGLV